VKKQEGPKLHDRQRLIFEILRGRRFEKMLEIGCATGYLSGVLKRFAGKMTSIDINPEYVRQAKMNVKGVRFFLCPAEKLIFKESGFDAVIFLDVLEHTLDPAKAVSQIHSKMRKGGTLYLSVPHKGWFAFLDADNVRRWLILGFPGFYRWLYRTLTGKNLAKIDASPLHRHYSVREIKGFLGEDFNLEDVYLRGCLLYPLGLLADPFVKRMPLVGAGVQRILEWLLDLDFRIGFGPASYNLLVVARKR